MDHRLLALSRLQFLPSTSHFNYLINQFDLKGIDLDFIHAFMLSARLVVQAQKVRLSQRNTESTRCRCGLILTLYNDCNASTLAF